MNLQLNMVNHPIRAQNRSTATAITTDNTVTDDHNNTQFLHSLPTQTLKSTLKSTFRNN